MSLIQLWTDFLSQTRPIINGSILFVYIQMIWGAVFPLRMIYRLTKRENTFETFILCVIPFILIGTVAIVEPLFFGSFLGAGFRETDALRAFLAQPAFFWDTLALSGVFSVSAALYLIVEWKNGKLSIRRALSEVGIESLLVLVLIGLGLDYFYGGGGFLHKMGDVAVKWLVYGVYLLIFKSSLYLIGLLWHLLFGERTHKKAVDQPVNSVKWLKKYLIQSYRIIGCGFILFGVFYMLVVVYRVYLEEGVGSFLVALFLLGTAILGGGLWYLFLSLFPELIPNRRRMRVWGDKEWIAQLAYRELAEEKPLLKTNDALMTEHFMVIQRNYKRVFYLPLLQEVSTVNDKFSTLRRVQFRDGSRCSLNPNDPGGARVLAELEKRLRRQGRLSEN